MVAGVVNLLGAGVVGEAGEVVPWPLSNLDLERVVSGISGIAPQIGKA